MAIVVNRHPEKSKLHAKLTQCIEGLKVIHFQSVVILNKNF